MYISPIAIVLFIIGVALAIWYMERLLEGLVGAALLLAYVAYVALRSALPG